MHIIFPLIGACASWAALDLTGPPRVYGAWNPLSVFWWLIFIGFNTRLAAVCFGLTPQSERHPHEK